MVVTVPIGLLIPVEAALLMEPVRSSAMLFTFLVVAGIIGIQFHVVFKRRQAQVREREAGYTTDYATSYDLWQLDWRTGEVLRRPGERELIADQLARRRRDGQASSSDDAVGSAAADALPPSGPGEDHRLNPPV